MKTVQATSSKEAHWEGSVVSFIVSCVMSQSGCAAGGHLVKRASRCAKHERLVVAQRALGREILRENSNETLETANSFTFFLRTASHLSDFNSKY